MRYVAMVQARCGSTRLPDKVRMDLCGKPVLQWIIERLQNSRYLNEVVLVTSIEKANLPLLRLGADLGIHVFAGSENDVLDRYYQASRLIPSDYVVRVTGDCPCYDWGLLDKAIEAMEPDTDYLWDSGETLPDGLDLEIIKSSALKKSWEEARLASEREHVTQYMRKHPELFKIQAFPCPVKGLESFRWTLDEPEDFELVQKIYAHFLGNGQEYFQMQDILSYIEEHPEISRINAQYARNEGLAKSLREDHIVEI